MTINIGDKIRLKPSGFDGLTHEEHVLLIEQNYILTVDEIEENPCTDCSDGIYRIIYTREIPGAMLLEDDFEKAF